MFKYLGPGEDMMATQPGTIYRRLREVLGRQAAQRRDPCRRFDRRDPRRDGGGQRRLSRSASSSGRSRTRTTASRPTRSWTGRRRLGIGWSLTFSGVRNGRRRAAVQERDEQQRAHVPGHGRDERGGVGAVPDDLDGRHRQDAAAGAERHRRAVRSAADAARRRCATTPPSARGSWTRRGGSARSSPAITPT